MYFYNKQNNTNTKKDSEKQNPFAPSVKPTDIIEKSTKTSGDWLTKDIVRKNNTPEKETE